MPGAEDSTGDDAVTQSVHLHAVRPCTLPPKGRKMLTLMLIEVGIVVVVAVLLAADMARNGHPYIGD